MNFFLKYFRISFYTILLLLAGVSISYGQTIRVRINGSDEKSGDLRSVRLGEDYYFSAEEFAYVLGVNTYYDQDLEKFVLYLDGSQVTLTADNPFVKIGGDLYQMPVEALRYRSGIYMPVIELSRLMDKYLPGAYEFDERTMTLDVLPGGEINITGLNFEEKENGTLVRIRTSREFGRDISDWFDQTKYHLTIQFYKGKLDTVLMSDIETHGLVLRSTAFQFPESAQITFKLSRYTESHNIDLDPATGDILISLLRKGSGGRVQPVLPDTQTTAAADPVELEKESWKLNTVIIDPGHGGKDPGTLNGGLMEKDVVLDIALQLAKLLKKSALFEKVILTRETDVFVPLLDRAEIAKNNDGKLFVSIHVNSNKRRSVRGIETYFLRPGKNDDALEVLEVVQRENNVMKLYENSDPERELTDEDKMVLAMTQSAFVKESELLAQFVSEGIGRKVNWPNRGVKQAGFIVLWGVPMPNILVEVGFMSNTSQRNDLKTRAVRLRIAEGIFEGIRQFKNTVRK